MEWIDVERDEILDLDEDGKVLWKEEGKDLIIVGKRSGCETCCRSLER